MRGYGESIRDILIRLRYYASIAPDLSLYSLAFHDTEIAREVLRIEDEVDELYKRLIARMIVALRSLDEAPVATGLMAVSSALDTITDASADIATLVFKGYPAHPYITAIICHGEAVYPIRSNKGISKLPARVDILAVKRGGRYEVAPVTESIMEGDLLVVRGPIDEVVQLAEALESPIPIVKCGVELQVQAMGGDPLASTLLALKSTSRVMVDLAFYSLLNNDVEIAETVAEMEEYSDRLYHELLEYIVSSSYPGRARDMVSLLVLSKSLEELSDAAMRIANTVRFGQNAPVLAIAVREGEEAYVRVRVEVDDIITLESLDLEDKGFIPLALYKPKVRDWITRLTPTTPIERGDELILKYYRGSPSVERHMMEELESLKLRLVKAGRVEYTT